MIPWTSLLVATAVTVPLLAGEPVPAPASSAGKSGVMQWLEGDYLLGTWGGRRTQLAEKGVGLEFFYIGSLASNLDGGIKTGSSFQGAFLSTLDLDTEKLGLWEGGNFHIGGLWLHGNDHFSDNHVGDFNKVNLVDFPNAVRLWEAYYSQKLLDDKLTVKAGILSVDRDFIVPEYYNTLGSINFLNQTFFYPTLAFNLYDIPGFPKGKHALPSTPYTALGALFRWEPIDEFYVQAAVYDGNPDMSYHGTDIRINEDEGALFYFETGKRWNSGKTASGLPGSVKVGGYYHTDEFTNVYQGTASLIATAVGATPATPRDHSGNYGGYLLAEQYLWVEEGRSDPAMQGILGFFRLAGAPQDRNLTELGIDGGLVFKGVIPGRDWDTIGLGVSYLRISDDIRRSVRDANAAYSTGFLLPDSESAIELSYKAQLTAWWTLQPSLQWVLHPGGRTDLARQPGDAIAFLLQTTLRL